MVLGKRWLFSVRNEAKIKPLEKGRKSPASKILVIIFQVNIKFF